MRGEGRLGPQNLVPEHQGNHPLHTLYLQPPLAEVHADAHIH